MLFVLTIVQLDAAVFGRDEVCVRERGERQRVRERKREREKARERERERE